MTTSSQGSTQATLSPLMQQYHEVKSRYSDCLLFFRMGDFYELFYEDAITASKILEIALTSRNKNSPDPVPMCGVPHHSVSSYLFKLVSQNYKVAICEQLEDPSQTKGIVKRDVVRVITPGTRFESESLDSKSNNYTHAVFQKNTDQVFWTTLDYSTGSCFFGSHSNLDDWFAFASSQGFVEILVPQNSFGDEVFTKTRQLRPEVATQILPEFYFQTHYAKERIFEQFQTQTLSSIHPQIESGAEPLGALIKYFQETQKTARIPTLFTVKPWNESTVMHLDGATIRALDLLPDRNNNPFALHDLSLLTHLDQTRTAMGGRLLKKWILEPSLSLSEIAQRLNSVEHLIQKKSMRDELAPVLSEIYDFERLLSRLSLAHGRIASPRDLVALVSSILHSRRLGFLGEVAYFKPTVESLFERLAPLFEFTQSIESFLTAPAPLLSREGGIFEKGYNAELDELIDLCQNGEAWLAQYETQEREKTKIGSLKVRFNRVYGYYIEITKANLANVPPHYVRKQTMVGGERFITEELKAFEDKVLVAEKNRHQLELQLFGSLCEQFSSHSQAILDLSHWIATVDVIASFAKVSDERGYSKPNVTSTNEIQIAQAKHPTLSAMFEKNPPYREFITNDFYLNSEKNFILITGPNMGGKSTAMRTAALVALLAQMGCFVPAAQASIGIVDQIFTRIGAQDNSSQGESTFMVEMSEMSFILRHATARSLILIDEIGRGTSTYDGISLAWALAFEISTRLGARTLFSTHYHELTRLAEICPNVENKRVGVDFKADGKIRFLYKLEEGSAERSYGVHVARLAGLPSSVIQNAERILGDLERKKANPASTPSGKKSSTNLTNDIQLNLLM